MFKRQSLASSVEKGLIPVEVTPGAVGEDIARSLFSRFLELKSIFDRWARERYDRLEESVNAKRCPLYTSPSPRDLTSSRMPSSA